MTRNIPTLLVSAAVLAACADSIPHKNGNKAGHNGAAKDDVAMPVLVSSTEADLSRLNGQSIEGGNAAIVVTDSPLFDSVAVKTNASIRSRALTISAPITAMPNLTRWIGYVAGKVGSYTDFTYDATGARTKRTRYSAAGVDGAWFTADDVIAGYSLFDVTRGTTLASSLSFGGAGPDGVWFNVDDVMNQYSKALTDPLSSRLTHSRHRTPSRPRRTMVHRRRCDPLGIDQRLKRPRRPGMDPVPRPRYRQGLGNPSRQPGWSF